MQILADYIVLDYILHAQLGSEGGRLHGGL
jgi:hypothetical protein